MTKTIYTRCYSLWIPTKKQENNLNYQQLKIVRKVYKSQTYAKLAKMCGGESRGYEYDMWLKINTMTVF